LAANQKACAILNGLAQDSDGVWGKIALFLFVRKIVMRRKMDESEENTLTAPNESLPDEIHFDGLSYVEL
jgi:hypothetical protein